MTTISNAAFPSPVFTEAERPAAASQPPLPLAPSEAAGPQRSLDERALAASRTRLNSVELTMNHALVRNASSSAPHAMDGAGMAPPLSKNELYLSPKRDNRCFNAQVVLPTREIDSDTFLGGTTVACRHLAFEYFNSRKKSVFLSKVKDAHAIEQHFSGGRLRAANQGYLKLLAASTLSNSKVVSVNTFPEQVMLIARKMIEEKRRHADFLITTCDHVMALNVRIKAHNTVCVTLYDPNNTTNHFRVEAKGCDDYEALQTTADPLEHRCDQGNHAFTLHANQDFFSPQRALEGLDLAEETEPVQVLASFVAHALDRDDTALLEQLITAIRRVYPRGGSGLKDALAGSEERIPGLFRALQNGRSATVNEWMSGVRSCADAGLLSKGAMFKLFRAQALPDLTDGLYIAMQGKRLETVAAYLAQVTEAAAAGLLTKPQAKLLFNGTHKGVVSGIDVLFRKGDATSLQAVVEQLAQSYRRKVFNASDINEVLLGVNSAYTENFMAGAHSRDIKAFEQVLQPLVDAGALTTKQRQALFTSRGFVDASLSARMWRAFG